jgi:uncharacterized damage-inducible protein DinB
MSYIDDNAAARDRILALINGLTDEQLREPIDGDWTIGAILGHLAFWDGVHAGRLRHALALGNPAPAPLPDGLSDAVNDGTLPMWRALDGRAALSLFEAASDETNAYLRDLDPAAVEGVRAAGQPRMVERYRHRNEHAETIERALRS